MRLLGEAEAWCTAAKSSSSAASDRHAFIEKEEEKEERVCRSPVVRGYFAQSDRCVALGPLQHHPRRAGHQCLACTVLARRVERHDRARGVNVLHSDFGSDWRAHKERCLLRNSETGSRQQLRHSRP